MASQVWLRDEIFQHGVLHNSARTSKRVTAIRLATILGQLAREDVTAVRYVAVHGWGWLADQNPSSQPGWACFSHVHVGMAWGCGMLAWQAGIMGAAEQVSAALVAPRSRTVRI